MKIHQLFRVIHSGLTSKLFACESSNSSELLPENFKVYVGENSVLNYPEDGYAEKTLPTFNHYKGKEGGYVAFYTH
jgi:hypothetical protein